MQSYFFNWIGNLFANRFNYTIYIRLHPLFLLVIKKLSSITNEDSLVYLLDPLCFSDAPGVSHWLSLKEGFSK